GSSGGRRRQESLRAPPRRVSPSLLSQEGRYLAGSGGLRFIPRERGSRLAHGRNHRHGRRCVMRRARVIVTGGTGTVGSGIVRELVHKGARVAFTFHTG